MRNMFRTAEGSLDKQYLRACATFKLLSQDKITADRAVELLRERHVRPSVVEVWVRHLERNPGGKFRWNGEDEAAAAPGM